MEEENRLKLRISRMFRSSVASCRPLITSDVVETAVLASKNQSLPSLCPDPAALLSINPTCIVSAKKAVSRLPRYCLPDAEHYCRYASLPALSHSPASTSFYRSAVPKHVKSRKKTKTKEKEKPGGRRPLLLSTSSQDTNTTCGGCDWFSFSSDDKRDEEVDDEGHWGDESDAMFSSISLSSDDSSAVVRRQRCNNRRGLPKAKGSRRKAPVDALAENAGDINDIKGSFAVVKRSSDPREDFRTSMVEMIMERQMFGAEELVRLLRCFLALNSSRHHGIIVQVFTEIWDTLFSSSSSVAQWSNWKIRMDELFSNYI